MNNITLTAGTYRPLNTAAATQITGDRLIGVAEIVQNIATKIFNQTQLVGTFSLDADDASISLRLQDRVTTIPNTDSRWANAQALSIQFREAMRTLAGYTEAAAPMPVPSALPLPAHTPSPSFTSFANPVANPASLPEQAVTTAFAQIRAEHVQELHARQQSHEQVRRELQSQLSAVQGELQAARAENADLQQSHEATQASSAAERAELAARISQYEQTTATLQTQLREISAEKEQLQKELRQTQQDHQLHLQETSTSHSAEKAALAQQLAILQATLETKTQELTTLQGTTQARIAEKERDLTALQHELTQAKEGITAAQTDLETNLAEINTRHAREMEALRGNFAEEATAREKAEESVTQLQQTLQKKERAFAELQTQQTLLEKNLATSKEQSQKVEAQLTALEAKNEKMAQLLASLQSEKNEQIARLTEELVIALEVAKDEETLREQETVKFEAQLSAAAAQHAEQLTALTCELKTAKTSYAEKEAELQTLIEKQKADLTSLQEQTTAAQREQTSKLTAAEQELAALRATQTETAQKLEEAQKDSTQSSSSIQALEAQLTQNAATIAELEKKLENAQTSFSAKESELSAQLETARKSLATKEEEFAGIQARAAQDVEARLSAAAAELAKYKSAYEQDVARLTSQVDTLQTAQKTKEEEVKQFITQSVASSLIKNTILQAQIEEGKAALAAFRQTANKENQAQLAQLLAAQEELARLQGSNTGTEGELARLKEELAAKTETFSTREQKLIAQVQEGTKAQGKLESNLAQATQDKQAQELSLAALQGELEALKSSQATVQAQLAEAQKSVTEKESQIASLTTSVAEKEANLENLRTQLKLAENNLEKEREKVLTEGANKDAQLAELSAQIQSLKTQSESQARSVGDKETILQELRAALTLKEKELSSLFSQLKLTTEELESRPVFAERLDTIYKEKEKILQQIREQTATEYVSLEDLAINAVLMANSLESLKTLKSQLEQELDINKSTPAQVLEQLRAIAEATNAWINYLQERQMSAFQDDQTQFELDAQKEIHDREKEIHDREEEIARLKEALLSTQRDSEKKLLEFVKEKVALLQHTQKNNEIMMQAQAEQRVDYENKIAAIQAKLQKTQEELTRAQLESSGSEDDELHQKELAGARLREEKALEERAALTEQLESLKQQMAQIQQLAKNTTIELEQQKQLLASKEAEYNAEIEALALVVQEQEKQNLDLSTSLSVKEDAESSAKFLKTENEHLHQQLTAFKTTIAEQETTIDSLNATLDKSSSSKSSSKGSAGASDNEGELSEKEEAEFTQLLEQTTHEFEAEKKKTREELLEKDEQIAALQAGIVQAQELVQIMQTEWGKGTLEQLLDSPKVKKLIANMNTKQD